MSFFTFITKFLPVIISFIALFLSIIAFKRDYVPLTIIDPTVVTLSAEIHSSITKTNFSKIKNNTEYIYISFRIINPRATNLSIFNINVLDSQDNEINFIKKLHFQDMEIQDLFLHTNEKLIRKLNIPESIYQMYGNNSFNVLDFLIEADSLKGSKTVKIFFRDTRPTFLKKYSKEVKSDVGGLKHPYHFYELPV
ncbi:hypothetical protein [Miniphocaeibacter massiliensis]|uniref:hypothetical protein n=1 Tax=Miniphocaeibacter massiliensis TaxID=2041841 RepID=UPI000C1C0EB5|nr:hypothetical protein [Miniphocaeibacter massiliensis]